MEVSNHRQISITSSVISKRETSNKISCFEISNFKKSNSNKINHQFVCLIHSKQATAQLVSTLQVKELYFSEINTCYYVWHMIHVTAIYMLQVSSYPQGYAAPIHAHDSSAIQVHWFSVFGVLTEALAKKAKTN